MCSRPPRGYDFIGRVGKQADVPRLLGRLGAETPASLNSLPRRTTPPPSTGATTSLDASPAGLGLPLLPPRAALQRRGRLRVRLALGACMR